MSKKETTISSFLEDIISQIDTGSNSQRNNHIAMTYFGFDGNGGNSMQASADPYDLTRESVRQITNKISSIINKTVTPPKELFEEAIKIIDGNTPAAAEVIERKLCEAGLIDEGFKIEGVINIITILNKKIAKLKASHIVKHNNVRFVLNPDQEKLPRMIESIAKTRISHNGATSIEEVSKRVKGLSKATKLVFVKSIVTSIPSHVWIGEDEEWFFLGSNGRNRLMRRLSFIFSAIESAPLHNIRKAIARSWKKNEVENLTQLLSDKILRDLIDACEDFHIDENNMVTATNWEKPEDHLNEVELIIFDVLKNEESGTIREKALEDSILEKIEGKWAFSVSLNYSPLIIKSEDLSGKEIRGSYELVGKAR